MTAPDRSALTPVERWIFVTFALTVIIASIVLSNNPAELQSTKKDGADNVIESTTTEHLRSDFIILLTAAGFVLFFIGVNGSRLTKLTVGSVTADLAPPEVKAAEAFSAVHGPIREVSTDHTENATDSKQLAPDGSPSGKVIFQGEIWNVYSAQATSARAVQRALNCWPSNLSKPKSLSRLSFALAKQRDDYWQWVLKFAEQPAVSVN